MYRIVTKTALKPTVILYEIEAPMVAKKAQPGQFIILRSKADSERIPLTIADYDRENGTITIIYQIVAALPWSPTAWLVGIASKILWAPWAGAAGGFVLL